MRERKKTVMQPVQTASPQKLPCLQLQIPNDRYNQGPRCKLPRTSFREFQLVMYPSMKTKIVSVNTIQDLYHSEIFHFMGQ